MKTSQLQIVLISGAVVGITLLTLPVLFPNGQKSDSTKKDHDPENSNAPLTGGHPGDDSAIERIPEISDPALQTALAENDTTRRQVLLERWADSIEVKDLAKMLEQVGSISTLKVKSEVSAALLHSWSSRDLPGAVSWFGQRSGADHLQEQARDLLGQAMAARDPVAMLSWMENSLPASSRSELYGPFFRQWMKADPIAAATKLSQLANPQGGNSEANTPWNDLLGQAAAQWANTNVNQAVGWVQSLPNSAAKSQALLQISSRWTEVSPQAAASYAAARGDVALLDAVAGKWAASDPASAAAWVSRLPAGAARDGATTSLATIWAENDLAAASEYVATLPPGAAQNRATAAVVFMWASVQPAQAAQWVSQFPEGSARERAVETLVGSWAGTNANDAAQWLQSLPKTRSRDIAIDAYSRATYTSNPGNAFQWGENISDETLRNQQLISVARYWLQKDPNAAREQINYSNLPQNLKADLLANSPPSYH